MDPLLVAASELQTFCDARGWRCCVIGGLALLRWGRSRATADVDLSLLTGLGDEMKFIDALMKSFPARRPDARQFALDNRVLLLTAGNRVPIDVSLAAFAFEQRMIQRATAYDFAANCSIRTASAEDLLVLKAFADRPQDRIDVEGLVERQRKILDWRQVIADLTELCDVKEDFTIVPRLEELRQRTNRP